MIRKKTRLMTSAAALLAVLTALLVAIPLMSTRSAAADEFEFVIGINDDGSLIKESKPYTTIVTYEDFQKINESDESLAGNYVLESDITLPADWESIGSKSGAFTGCFEGKGYTITIGAEPTGSNMKTVPFFNNNGVIHNVKVTGTVSVNSYFGSVVSSNGSGAYVIDCSSDAKITVTGSGYVGGIVGNNRGTVYKCQFTGTLATETMNGASYYGGIAGKNEGTVDSCANYGSIGGCVNVGGIAGQNDSNCTVKDCLNAADISANATDAGGITGSNFGTISSSFTSGNVTLAEYRQGITYGGICASNSGTVTETYYDRGQFPGDGIGDGDTVDYTCGVYPWEIEDVELDGWTPAQVTKDSGDTSKKRTTEYSLPYPDRAASANKTSSLFRFETKDGFAWKSYISITDADGLKAIADSPDECYVLENVITLSDDWEPLGMNSGSPFTGCFDGNGHTIKGLNVNTPSGSYQGYGLFGYVTGSIVDVNVEGSVLAMRSGVGGIVGYANGAFIKNCSFNGSVSGGVRVGGIVGLASGGTEISGCYSYGSVTADSSVSGGIVGDLTGKITDCFSSAEVSGTFNVGGIIGSVNNNPTVTNCIFAGKVNYTEGPHGGISGQEGGSYTNCYYLSGCFASGDYDTQDGTALSPVELASLTNDDLGDAWESGSVGTDFTVADSTYHTYKTDCTFPKLVKMATAVTGSAEVYNFGIDGNDDYQAFTAIKTVDDLKNIEKDVTGNYVIMVDELDASGMKSLCGNSNKFAGKLAGNGCKLTLSKPLFEYNSGLVMGINAAGTIDGSSGYDYGAIAQLNSGGTIYGCSFSGSVTAFADAGGICGQNVDGGVIRKCYNTGTVTAQDEFAGGIVGIIADSSTIVSECYNTGSVSGKERAGGIVGESYDYSEISDCLNTGRITGEKHVGGIVGIDIGTTISRVLNAGIAYAPRYYGCISGTDAADSTYTDCYFIAELSAANYSGKGTGVSIGKIAELNLGSAWNKGSLGTLSTADSDGFKSQNVTLPSLNGVGTAQPDVAYQFNFKENPSDNDNWLYTTRVTTVDELQTACTTGNIALANDIVFTDSDPAFIALGVHAVETVDNLHGYFSGNGHTIKNIKLKGDNTYKDAALFTWSFGVIMDLTMDGTITVTDADYAAAVCANNDGTIIRCHNAADISGGSNVGGIAYSNDGTIINCWNTGSITGKSSASGICYVVYSNGKVISCYNIGALSAYSTYGISVTPDKDKIQNSYYMSDAPGDDKNAKTAKAFASGEVAYLLNGDQSTIAWGQEIGKNAYPVPGGMRVYASSPCASIFTNDNSDLHKEHDYVDGKCRNCGEYKAPSQDADGYYLLGSKSELEWFARAVNGGSNDINAKLTADITLNENVLDKNGNLANGDFEQWEPIGSDDKPYIGIFDGNGHTVSGMYVSNLGNAGLFGLIEEARISNLTVADSYVSGRWAGGIAGFAENSVIENCVNRGYVDGDYAGGITSVMGDYSDTTDCGIRGCVNTGKVAGYTQAGGITSDSDFDIKDCANYGSVEPFGFAHCAGITAHIEKNCSIINCLSVGTVYGDTSNPLVCYAIEYTDDGDDMRYAPTADNIKNSYYNKDLFALDSSEEMNWLEENCGKTTLELTSGNIFGGADWTKPDNDFDNKALYYPVPASVAKNVDQALLKIPFTSQMKLDNTDTAPVYGDTLNFTVKAEVKPEGAANFSSAAALCKPADFELYLGDVLLDSGDYTITLSDGTLSVAVSKAIDAGTHKFTIKGVSGYVKDDETECTVTIGRKAFTGDISVPTAENETTCGHKLSEVKLSNNEWKWADGTIITDADSNGFKAVFTVTDDNNYDYTGVEGYDKAAHTITRTIAVTVNHHLTEVAAKAATCNKDGNSQYFICDCGKLFTDSTAKTETTLADVTIKAAGHKFGDWVTTKEPTSTSTGIKTRTCSVCGATEEDTIPKKSGSSSGGSSGGGSSRPSGGSSSTSDSKPSINGKQKSWSDISSDIAKLPAGGSATINTNGETNVPADVIKSIKDSKAKVELIIDSTKSWIIDGLRISKVSAADLSILPGNADRSTLRGTSGADLKISGTGVPADLKLTFRKKFAGQFANIYKLTDGKLVFQNCVKVDENGAATISGADTKGEYIVMVCESSDILGDMNNDGVLNALDAAAILKEIVGTAHSANPLMGDFNGDGAVNALDASAILKWIIAA